MTIYRSDCKDLPGTLPQNSEGEQPHIGNVDH